MSFRIEEKLFIDNNNFFEFKKWLTENKAIKIYNDRIVSSIYFDNSRMDIYHNSNEGILPRKKIRYRTYNNNFNKGNGVLELKISSAEGRFKTVIKNKEFNSINKCGLFDKDYGTCKPKVKVSYKRSYFKIFNIRLTLDQNIEFIKYNSTVSPVAERSFIAEIKSNNIKNIKYINEKFKFNKTRFSKYCKAVEKLKII